MTAPFIAERERLVPRGLLNRIALRPTLQIDRAGIRSAVEDIRRQPWIEPHDRMDPRVVALITPRSS